MPSLSRNPWRSREHQPQCFGGLKILPSTGRRGLRDVKVKPVHPFFYPPSSTCPPLARRRRLDQPLPLYLFLCLCLCLLLYIVVSTWLFPNVSLGRSHLPPRCLALGFRSTRRSCSCFRRIASPPNGPQFHLVAASGELTKAEDTERKTLRPSTIPDHDCRTNSLCATPDCIHPAWASR